MDEVAVGPDNLLARLRAAERDAAEARAELQATRRTADEAIKALAESEKRYRLMGETIPFGVWWCNPKGEAEYVSPSFCELLNMSLEEQNRFGWTRRLVPEDVEPMLAHWRFCCDTGTPWDYEHRVIDRHGELHTVLSRGLPVRDDNSPAIKAWVGVNLDITARKRIELELKEAKDALEQALRVKDQFLANISHELRTPLTLILGPVRALAAAANLDDEQRRDLGVVERNARTLLRTVNDLLDLSKLDAGRMEAEYAAVDLAWLSRWVASHFEAIGQERGIGFSVDVPAALPAEADPEKLQRILLNLLSNAFKFTPAGGAVRFAVRLDGDQAQFVVEDNGPGIPADMREAIFERFRQVDASATRSFGGTGLGLAIVKEFVGLHGGAVRACEAQGGGARFEVTLPLRAPTDTKVREGPRASDELARTAVSDLHAAKATPPAARAVAKAAKGTVLVVEDNPEMNAFLARALGREHTVACAFNGREALEMARRIRPDLIVTDLMMPVMSGEELVKAIHAAHELEDVRVLVLTAKADERTRVEQLEHGAHDVLLKPFVAEELLARARRLIEDRRQAELQLRESHALLHAVTEGVDDAIFVKDRDGRYALVNTAGARRLGKRSPVEVVGQDDVALLGPSAAEKIRSDDVRAMASDTGITFEEVRGLDGDRRHYLTSKAPYRDGAGGVIGVLGIARDVTTLKRIELELRRLQAELEQRVAQRTEELAGANRELEAFVYTASHDLQAPLRHIDAFAQLLRRRAAGSLDAKSLGDLDQITKASARMGALITDLLGLSRIGRATMVERPVDLAGLADEVLHELKPQSDGRSIDVQIARLPTVQGDVNLLRSVLTNLLSNALKFTRPRDRARIEVGWREERDHAVVFVRDNGVGFDRRMGERLFGLFQRLHPMEKFEGTGVGLASVKRAVERHGGAVWAEGDLDRGASFFFSLPIERVRRDAARGTAAPGDVRHEPGHAR